MTKLSRSHRTDLGDSEETFRPTLSRKVMKSQSHRTDLGDSESIHDQTWPALQNGSQSHRTDLGDSEGQLAVGETYGSVVVALAPE